MNPSLAPELAHLEAQLAQLYAQIDAGQLTPAQAQPVLDTMGTFDAYGNRWSVSPQGRPPNTVFVVQPSGQPAQIADPSRFVRPGAMPPAAPAPVAPPAPHPMAPGPAAGDPRMDALLTPPSATGGQAPPLPGPQTVPPGVPVTEAASRASRFKLPSLGRRAPAEAGAPQPGRAASRTPRIELPEMAGVWRWVSEHRRTLIVAAVALVLVIVVLGRGRGGSDGDSGTQGPAPVTCTPSTLSGIGDRAALAGCLAAVGQPSLLDLVTVDGASGPQFAAAATMSRAGAVYAATALYLHAGGAAPAGASTAGLENVPDSLRPVVAQGVALGLTTPAFLVTPSQAVTRGEAAALLNGALAKVLPPATPGAAARDAQGVDPGQAQAQAVLAARQITDTAPGAEYGFGRELDTGAFVTMYGRGAQALRSFAGSDAAPVAQPTETEVGAVLYELLSGRRQRTAAVVARPGSASEVALHTATLQGLVGTRLTVTLSPAVKGKSLLVVTNPATKSTVASASVRWVQNAGRWQLAEWPALKAQG